MDQGNAAVELQPAPPVLAGAPHTVRAGDKVALPGEGGATEYPSLTGFVSPRAQTSTPIRSFLSSLLSAPKLSDAELEAVRLAERQRILSELARADVERKKRAEAEAQKRVEKPVVL